MECVAVRGLGREASKADRFLPCSLLSTDPTPVHVAVVCGRRLAAPWSSWQPGLGVGRYGESVPLLLIDRTLGQKRTPPVSTGLQAIDSEILMKSCPTWWAGSPNCPRHPATAQVRSITQAVIKARRALRYDFDTVLARRANAGARLHRGKDISAVKMDQAAAHPPGGRGAGWPRLAARDQVRRLPHACQDRPRLGQQA
jgi:hypothetical protein